MTKKHIEKSESFILDKSLLLILFIFMVTSLVAIYASAPHIGGDATHHVVMQTIFFIVSFAILIFICLGWGIDRVFILLKYIYAVLLVMMILLLVDKYGIFQVPFVSPVNWTWAWYHFPGVSFQPSEFMKIVLVLMSAGTIHKHNLQKEKNSFNEDFKLFAKIGSYTLPVLILNFLQPDTGVPLIMVISILVMLLVSGIRREWFFIIANCVCCWLLRHYLHLSQPCRSAFWLVW